MRTRLDGHWKKFTYQDATFAITLSGLMKFDNANFTGWDMLNNLFNFNHVLARCSFNDENGNVKTVQGYVMIETGTLGISQGALVKNDFNLQGHGKLDMFDGLVPCPTLITGITVNGQENSDGVVHVSYTYAGEAYQVKYRIDNTGDYIYALADLTIDVPGLSVSSHSIEIIPVCVNGYEGTGMTVNFVVTQAMTCSSAITGMIIHTSNSSKYSSLTTNTTVSQDSSSDYISPVLTGGATTYMYAWDGSNIFTTVPAGTNIPIGNLPIGPHVIALIPICTFPDNKQVYGAGTSQGFTLLSQPAQSKVNYSYINFPPNNSLNIYVNGVLTISLTDANAASFIMVPAGATVKSVLQSSQTFGLRAGTLTITDNTTGIRLFNQSAISPFTVQYTFTANGDEFTILGVVSA